MEEKELEDQQVQVRKAASLASRAQGKGSKKGSGKKGGGGGGSMHADVMPSPAGIRVEPRIPEELRTKAAKAAAAKERKGKDGGAGAGKKVSFLHIFVELLLLLVCSG